MADKAVHDSMPFRDPPRYARCQLEQHHHGYLLLPQCSPFTHRNELSPTRINPLDFSRGGQQVRRKDEEDQGFSEI